MAAEKFVRNLRKAAGRLRRFPLSGWMVEEWQDPNIREILYGNYRIIHRVRDNVVQVMIVIHGARLLDEDPLKDE
jgi:plasmid stabilization system protein ParE